MRLMASITLKLRGALSEPGSFTMILVTQTRNVTHVMPLSSARTKLDADWGDGVVLGRKKISRPWPKVAPCLNATWRRFDEKQR